MFLNTGQANHHHTGQPQRFPIHHFPLTTLPAPKDKCVYQPEQTQGQQHIYSGRATWAERRLHLKPFPKQDPQKTMPHQPQDLVSNLCPGT